MNSNKDCSERNNLNTNRQRVGKYEDVENCLHDWLLEMRRNNVPLNGPILCEKAISFNQMLNQNNNFSPNSGWLHLWKKRFGIGKHVVSGECNQVDDQVVSNWINRDLPILVADYSPDCLYNCDETGLFWKMLPEATLDVKGKKCSGGKQQKDRLTILFCCNSDGSDKIEPLVVGKYAKPRCFKDAKHVPVNYTNTKNAWMTSALFMDNFSGHNIDLVLENVKITFYPPNCTSVLQPLDQGIIKNFKCFYRTKILRQIIGRLDTYTAEDPINLLDALHFIRSSWKDVKSTTIVLKKLDII